MSKTLKQLVDAGLWEKVFVDQKTGQVYQDSPGLNQDWIDSKPYTKSLNLVYQDSPAFPANK